MDNGEFYKQLGGSGAANALTAVLFFLLWVVRNKCRHSECTGSSFCCTCKVKDDDSEDERDREREWVPKITKKEMHEV